jgi:hypothetical protein
LKGVAALERITLAPETIDDAMLAALAKLPNLRSINCRYTARSGGNEVDDCIDIRKTKVTSQGLGALSRFKAAERFVLPPSLLDDDALAAITAAPAFDSLNCEVECGHCMGGSVPCLATSCVDTTGSSITDAGVRKLRSLGLKRVLAPRESLSRYRKLLPGTKVITDPTVLFGGGR